MLAVSQRNPKPGGHRACCRDAGNDVNGNVFTVEVGDFLAGPAKDHRIAGLEPHHPFARLGELYHHSVDVLLTAALASAAFSHQHAPRLPPSKLQHLGGNEVVEEDDVGRLQGAHCLQRQ